MRWPLYNIEEDWNCHVPKSNNTSLKNENDSWRLRSCTWRKRISEFIWTINFSFIFFLTSYLLIVFVIIEIASLLADLKISKEYEKRKFYSWKLYFLDRCWIIEWCIFMMIFIEEMIELHQKTLPYDNSYPHSYQSFL